MTDTPSELSFLSKAMAILVDDSTPYRTHNAISIYSALILGICTIGMTVACIIMTKSLAIELGTLVTATAGLAGYQYAKGTANSNNNLSNNTSVPPKAPVKPIESKEGEG